MAMSYWYIAHSDELLLDLDAYMRPTRSGCPWGEAFFRRRLRDAIAAGKLQVRDVWLVNSSSEKHYHAFVRLKSKSRAAPGYIPSDMERLGLQMDLGLDL